MNELLLKIFVKNYQDVFNPLVRQNYGILVGVVGIGCNTLLSGVKISVGFLFGNLAILADGVNNLSDAGNSLVTIIGFRLAAKPADKEHPYGHARYEYISGLIIAIIIILLAVDLARSSIAKIINPGVFTFNYLMVLVLVASILVKVWLVFFNRYISKKINSITIKANVQDSINDIIATTSILVSLYISQLLHLQLEGFISLIVSVFIGYSGISMIIKALSLILGEAPSREFVETISAKIRQYPGVLSIHDLMIHNYGYDQVYASVHVEVSAKEQFIDIHQKIDVMERDFWCNEHIKLVVHLDPIVLDDPLTSEMYNKCKAIIKNINDSLKIHDFRMIKGKRQNKLIFDVVVPFNYKLSNLELIKLIDQELKIITAGQLPIITVIDIDRG